MPIGDGTGPDGFGPMTGRGLGYCAGYNVSGYTWGHGGGRGRGWGRRGGRGRSFGIAWGHIPSVPFRQIPSYPLPTYSMGANMTPEIQLNMFKQEKQYLESELENIKNALEEISKNIEKLEQSK